MASIDNMEQSIASAVRFVLDNDVDGAKAYFDEIPDSYYVPSVYFPIPNIEGKKATFQSYLNTITFAAWFCARKDWEAEARAASVRDALMLQGLRIPILNKDGSATGKAMMIQEPVQRKIEEGIVSITIPVKSYFKPVEQEKQKIESFIMTWKKATAEFREEDS